MRVQKNQFFFGLELTRAGVGFPDIKMIEPLAETLGVSILEIMRSEKMNEQPVPMESAMEAINNVIDVVAYQRKIERRNILITVISFSTFIHFSIMGSLFYLMIIRNS